MRPPLLLRNARRTHTVLGYQFQHGINNPSPAKPPTWRLERVSVEDTLDLIWPVIVSVPVHVLLAVRYQPGSTQKLAEVVE